MVNLLQMYIFDLTNINDLSNRLIAHLTNAERTKFLVEQLPETCVPGLLLFWNTQTVPDLLPSD